MNIRLHPRLAQDCILLGRFRLCLLLLMNDARYPWFILVPDREAISEIYQLSPRDQATLQEESSHLAECLATLFAADKMNIASLGNVVPQLHIHHIVRYTHDPAWPGPVWGKRPPVPYGDATITDIRRRLAEHLEMGYTLHI